MCVLCVCRHVNALGEVMSCRVNWCNNKHPSQPPQRAATPRVLLVFFDLEKNAEEVSNALQSATQDVGLFWDFKKMAPPVCVCVCVSVCVRLCYMSLAQQDSTHPPHPLLIMTFPPSRQPCFFPPHPSDSLHLCPALNPSVPPSPPSLEPCFPSLPASTLASVIPLIHPSPPSRSHWMTPAAP